LSPYSLQFTSDWGYPPKEVSEGVRRERPASAPKMDEVVCAHKKKISTKGGEADFACDYNSESAAGR